MSNRPSQSTVKRSVAAVAVVLVVVAVGYIRSRGAEKPAHLAAVVARAGEPTTEVARQAVEPLVVLPEQESQVAPIQALQPAPALAEEVLMSKLRDSADGSPSVSLALAREGNQRFPDSPDAAERAWWVCKSLVNLTDFAEAREEARAMVLKYPGTSFALDIERHLLINPGGPPDSPEGSDSAQ